MSGGTVAVARDGHVARITLSDPQRHNAMSLAMWQALEQAMAAIDADREVRVCVLRGAGEQAFVSGANIAEFDSQRSSDEGVRRYNDQVARTQRALSRCRVPVIAAISGVCYGGGMGLALACDLRYAAPNARFRMPAARLGLGYDVDNLQSLLDSLSPMACAEAFYTARVYGAPQARELGLVQAVVGDVFAHCDTLAAEIAANAPLTVQAAKLAMVGLLERDPQRLEAARAAAQACFTSTDYAEGRLAFAQKRPPQFTGH